jgi:hypothetical protein
MTCAALLFYLERTELFLDHFENLLLVKLLRQTLDGCQSLTTIALLDADVDVILGLLRFPSIVVGLREGVCPRKKSVISVGTGVIYVDRDGHGGSRRPTRQ